VSACGSRAVSPRRPARRVPARSDVMAPSAREADFTTTLPLCHRPQGAVPPPQLLRPGPRISGFWVGAFIPPGGWGRPSLRKLRAPGARIGAGVSVTRSHADTEGSPAPNALPGRSRRSLGAPRVPRRWRGGTSQRREAAHPPGKTKASRSEERRPAPGPRGKKKASRSEAQTGMRGGRSGTIALTGV